MDNSNKKGSLTSINTSKPSNTAAVSQVSCTSMCTSQGAPVLINSMNNPKISTPSTTTITSTSSSTKTASENITSTPSIVPSHPATKTASVLNAMNTSKPCTLSREPANISTSQLIPALVNITNTSKPSSMTQAIVNNSILKPLSAAPAESLPKLVSKTRKCKYCGNTYTHSSSLSKHLKKAHSETKVETRSISCNLCNDRYVI